MPDAPESKSRTSDGRFVEGCPAGPGRPRKVVKAAADALDERVAQAAGDLYDVALGLAREGNATVLKMLLDRVWPAGRPLPLEAARLEINNARGMLAAQAAVTDAVFAGEATAAEAGAVTRQLEAHLKVLDRAGLEQNLEDFRAKRKAEK